ncbi:hypothetical protein VPHD51_0022 [Vibrio phage D51]
MDIFNKSQLDLRSNPNLLINGDFSVWQRGTSFTNTSWAYTADRWQVRGRTGVTNRKLVSGSLGSLIRLDIGSSFPVGEHTALQQRIEDMDMNLLGKTKEGYTYTMSFATQATGVSHGGRCYISVANLDTGDFLATSNDVSFTFGDRVEAVLDLPAWTTTDNTDQHVLIVYIETDINPPVGGFNIANVKLEEGSVATPFISDDPATNLAKCQRYYYKWTDVEGTAGDYYANLAAEGGTVRYASIPLPVSMRTPPSVQAQFSTGTIENTFSNHTVARFNIHSVSTGVTCYLIAGTFEADAEL